MSPFLGYHFGPLLEHGILFTEERRFLRGPISSSVLGSVLSPISYLKSLRKRGRRDKRKRRKLERQKCGLDMAGAIREALEVVWRKSQNRQKEEKKSVPKWEPVLDSVLNPKTEPFWRRNNL